MEKVKIKDIREFNNCGNFIIASGDYEYFTKWTITNGEYIYNTNAPEEVLLEARKQFELEPVKEHLSVGMIVALYKTRFNDGTIDSSELYEVCEENNVDYFEVLDKFW